MKRFIPLFFLFFITHLGAQSVILLEQDSVSQINEDVDITDNFIHFALDLYFENVTEDSILVNWRRELGENCPAEWDIITADQMLTYTPDVNESHIPIPMTPVDSHFIVREIFFPQTVAGCCDITMIFSLEDDPDNPIDTGYYHIEINSNECVITSVSENVLEKVNVYPNPTSDILNFENGQLIESIEIVDLNGKIHLQGIYSDPDQIDISSLKPGLYFCKIRKKTGKLLVKKIVKK